MRPSLGRRYRLSAGRRGVEGGGASWSATGPAGRAISPAKSSESANGLLGLGALINVRATLPANYIAFECPSASDPWRNDIVTGLPKQVVKDSMIDLLEAPVSASTSTPTAPRDTWRKRTRGFFD